MLERDDILNEDALYAYALQQYKTKGIGYMDSILEACNYIVKREIELPVPFSKYLRRIAQDRISGRNMEYLVKGYGGFDIYPFLSELGLVGQDIHYVGMNGINLDVTENIRNYISSFRVHGTAGDLHSNIPSVILPQAEGTFGGMYNEKLSVDGKLTVLDVLSGHGHGFVVSVNPHAMFTASSDRFKNEYFSHNIILRNYLSKAKIGDKAIVVISESEFERNISSMNEIKTHIRKYYDAKWVVKGSARVLYIEKTKEVTCGKSDWYVNRMYFGA